MVRYPVLLPLLFLCGICVHLSCHSLNILAPLSGKSLSSSASPNTPTGAHAQPKSVTVEIYIIRFTPHQHELVQELWRETEEQSLPTQLRRELVAQGFRVGILGNSPSPTLALLLQGHVDDKPDVMPSDFQEFSVSEVIREEGATRHTRQLLPGMRAVLKPFDDQNALSEISLFRREQGKIHGETYLQAVGVFLVGAEADKDGSAQIQIVPVLEHGTSQRRIRTVAGMVVPEEGRPRHVFESLIVSQRLFPGQWIIMGAASSDSLNSLGAGDAFFTRKQFSSEHRLMAIRLVRAMQ